DEGGVADRVAAAAGHRAASGEGSRRGLESPGGVDPWGVRGVCGLVQGHGCSSVCDADGVCPPSADAVTLGAQPRGSSVRGEEWPKVTLWSTKEALRSGGSSRPAATVRSAPVRVPNAGAERTVAFRWWGSPVCCPRAATGGATECPARARARPRPGWGVALGPGPDGGVAVVRSAPVRVPNTGAERTVAVKRPGGGPGAAWDLGPGAGRERPRIGPGRAGVCLCGAGPVGACRSRHACGPRLGAELRPHPRAGPAPQLVAAGRRH